MSRERVYNVGLVGTGYMAQKHAQALAAHPRVRCRALHHTPRSAARAAEWRGLYGFAATTADYGEFLSAPGLDAVWVCSPNDQHLAQAEAALRAGKHVFCEKPLALRAADAARLSRLAEQAGLVLAVGMNCRFRSQYAEARRVAASGELGNLFLIRGTYLYHSGEAIRGRQKPWWLDESNQPLLITSGLIHTLDLMVWVAGEVAEVAALGASALDGAIGADTLLASLRFEGGAVGELSASLATVRPNDLTLEIYGGRGSLVGTTRYGDDGGGLRESVLEVSQPVLDLGLQVENVLAAVEGREPLLNDSRRAARNLRVCEGLAAALAGRRSVALDYSDLGAAQTG